MTGFQICDKEAEIVRMIFRLYVRGDETGRTMPLNTIARRLEQMGIPTPGHAAYKSRGARGIWSQASVRTIVLNETYAGVWHYGNRQGDSRKRTPVDGHIQVKVPAIVDRRTWEAAQVQSKRNKAMAKRNTRRDYLLRGLIHCGCGRSMTGFLPGHRTTRRYVCIGKRYIKADCQERTIKADDIEGQIWEELHQFFSNLKRLEKELKLAQRREVESDEPKREELKMVESNIKQAEGDAEDIADVLTKARGKVKESLDKRMDEVNARYDNLINRRDELESEIGQRHLTDEAVDNILTYAREVRDGIETAKPEDKRRILESLGVGVTVKNGDYLAKCILGEWTGTIKRQEKVIENGMS